jgi:hypothetical protein
MNILLFNTTVHPDPALVVYTLVAAAGVCAAIATAAKGRWWWFLIGLLTGGITFFLSAFLPAVPDSVWGRRRRS